MTHVTFGLIGTGEQQQNELGEFELMLCLREQTDWAPALLSALAPSTFDVPFEDGDFVDVESRLPENSNIAFLLLVSYCQLNVSDIDAAGVMLAIGVTKEEQEYCSDNDYSVLLEELKSRGIYPYTDLERISVFS